MNNNEMSASVPPWDVVKGCFIPPHLIAKPMTEENYEKYCELVRWIESFPVTQFISLTFAQPTSETVAVSLVKEWHDALEWLNKAPIGLLWCIENEGDELHVHGVLMGAPNLTLKTAESVWRSVAGDGDVRKYESGRRGVAYSLKEAFWTNRWDLERLDYYSVHGKKRRPQLARQYLKQHLDLELANSLLPGGSFGFACRSGNDEPGGLMEITSSDSDQPKSQPTTDTPS